MKISNDKWTPSGAKSFKGQVGQLYKKVIFCDKGALFTPMRGSLWTLLVSVAFFVPRGTFKPKKGF